MASFIVTTTPQKLPSGAERDARSLSTNTQTIWRDSTSDVSSSTGTEVLPGEGFWSATNDPYPVIWVVVASGTADLRYTI